MKVINKGNLPLIDYRKLKPLQGNLKDLNRPEYDKLLESFEHHGFFVPAYIWFKDDVPYIIDMHQRHRVLTGENIKFENTGYEIPYVEIEADTELEAMQKLLVVSSQYGKITQEGFDEFTGRMSEMDGYDYEEIKMEVSFDALPYLDKDMDGSGNEDEQKQDSKIEDGVNFVIRVRSKEERDQAMQRLKDYAESNEAMIAEIFVDVVEAGVEKLESGL